MATPGQNVGNSAFLAPGAWSVADVPQLDVLHCRLSWDTGALIVVYESLGEFVARFLRPVIPRT